MLEYNCICGGVFQDDDLINFHKKHACPAVKKKKIVGIDAAFDEDQKVDSTQVRPVHYKVGGLEPWDYMEMKMSAEMFEGFLAGNVIKYMSRYSEKNGLEDLKKAQTYLTRLIGVYGRFKV